MPEQFTITDFIAHRWGEARVKLSRHDPAFVATMGVYFDVKERGLILPDTPPPPSYRLSAEWYELLEPGSSMLMTSILTEVVASVVGGDSASPEASSPSVTLMVIE